MHHNRLELLKKTMRVIYSCNTHDQFVSAIKYYILVIPHLNKDDGTIFILNALVSAKRIELDMP